MAQNPSKNLRVANIGILTEKGMEKHHDDTQSTEEKQHDPASETKAILKQLLI